MPTTWPTTPSTSCCSGGTRCPAGPWRPNLRSRGSRTARPAPRSTGWARVGGVRHRPASASSARAGAACHHRSGSDRRPDARRPAAHGSSMGTMAAGVICRCSHSLTFDREAEAVSVRGGAAGPPTQPRGWGPSGCCVGCSRCCGRRFHRRGFSSGSTGLCDAGGLRLPGCRTATRPT